MDMFYMDTNPGMPGSEQFNSTIAHEFQHMISFNMHPNHNEESWVNEGLSDYAILVCGYGIPSAHVDAFESDPNTALTSGFDPDDPNILRKYGASFLFVEYVTELVQRNGKTISDFTKSWENQEKVGIDGVNAVLPQFLPSDRDSFDEVFRMWAIANLLDDKTGDYGYHYTGLNLSVHISSDKDYQKDGIQFTGAVNGWATNYFKINFTDLLMQNIPFRIDFSGDKDSAFLLEAMLGTNPKEALLQHPTGVDWSGSQYLIIPKSLFSSYTLSLVVIHNSQGGNGNFHISNKITTKGEVTIGWGLDYLRRQHINYANGSWNDNVGITGLATLAFLNNGYHETDPDVQQGVQFLLSKVAADGSIFTVSNEKTYETSLAVIALKATRNSAYDSTITAAKNWLVSSQWDTDSIWGSVDESNTSYYGGFGYGGGQRPDMSNTQFALLALNAADLPASDPTWAKALIFVTHCQNYNGSGGNNLPWAANDGGFIYLPGQSLAGGTTSYGSMTGAGMWGLALAGAPTSDARFKSALGWVDNHYTWDHNPTTPGGSYDGALYYYYLSMSKGLSMARKTHVGGLLGIIGTHDWYKELTDKLVSLQHTDGSWTNSDSSLWENQPSLATSDAILALQTRQLPKNYRSLSGRPSPL
jgi:squalene-hopene/tetraprenyl-beta-curcumene cyclase